MRAYVCFDDTDTLDCGRGTGKLGRWMLERLPDGCTGWAVVRQQLLVHPDIPMTSHNSAACAVLEVPDPSVVDELVVIATALIEEQFIEGSDPGLCVATEADLDALARLQVFGRMAAVAVTNKAAAREAAAGVHLSEHGGTGDGIIGAAAGVGLTAYGWAGRLIEYRVPLRDFARETSVAKIEAAGIRVLAIDRNVGVPAPDDVVDTHDWLRPRLWGHEPAVPVLWDGEGRWNAVATRPGEEGAEVAR
jgi:tRNA(Ile2) C34 agmatinyltransferase TiaS